MKNDFERTKSEGDSRKRTKEQLKNEKKKEFDKMEEQLKKTNKSWNGPASNGWRRCRSGTPGDAREVPTEPAQKKMLKYIYESTPQQQQARYVPRHAAGIAVTGSFGKFGMTSIPEPDISVSSVRRRGRYRALR